MRAMIDLTEDLRDEKERKSWVSESTPWVGGISEALDLTALGRDQGGQKGSLPPVIDYIRLD